MRKLSVVIAALFLLGSAPAFAQTAGGAAESGSAMGDGGTEAGAAAPEKAEKTEKTEKKTHKKAKKAPKKGKGEADGGM